MDVTPTPTLLLVGVDHSYTAALRLALTAWSPVRLVGDVPPGEESVAHAARLRPDALLLAVNLPGQRLAPLVRALRVASPGSKMLVSAARVALDAAMVRALFEWGVRGCLTIEDAPPTAVPPYLMTVLAGGRVTTPGLAPPPRGAHERRRRVRVPGLVLTLEERARACTDRGAPRLVLWGHDPLIADGVRLYAGQVGLRLEVVDSAAALLDSAPESSALVLDCAAVPDPLARCLAIVAHTTRPVLICCPDEDFVADLRAQATAALVWVPPAWLGSRVRDKLRLLMAASSPLPAVTPALALTPRQQQVSALKAAGHCTRTIADMLGISLHTVKSHLAQAEMKREEGVD